MEVANMEEAHLPPPVVTNELDTNAESAADENDICGDYPQLPAPAGYDNAAFENEEDAEKKGETEANEKKEKPVMNGTSHRAKGDEEGEEVPEKQETVETKEVANGNAENGEAVVSEGLEEADEDLSQYGGVERRRPQRVSFSEPPQRLCDSMCGTGNTKERTFPPSEKWRILRNVTLLSAAFMLLFTSFFGAANLQSSVNADAGLGTVSLTAVYAALIVSNLFLPSVVVRWLGCKWTVCACMLLFTPYAAAQMSASWASLVPTALLLGTAGAPMWCAKCSYLNVAAGVYATVTGSPRDLVMVRFFGLFYVLFPLGHVWGNIITSVVLSTGLEDMEINGTQVNVSELCGANFCPALRSVEHNPNLARPPDYQIHTIAALFIALTLLAVLLVVFGVDNLQRYGEGDEDQSGGGQDTNLAGGTALLVATLRLLGDVKQIFLVPVTAFIGISQAFLGADFTESYIACAWGIRHIGYVLVGYGLASSLASVLVSWAVKRLGRLIVVSASIVLFLVLVATLKFWRPAPGQGVAFFALAAAWGVADCTALVINAMYGLLFRGREAAAYSNFSLWGSAGFIGAYSISPHGCMGPKLWALTAVLLLALFGFVMAERSLRRTLKEEEDAAVGDRVRNMAAVGVTVIQDKGHAA